MNGQIFNNIGICSLGMAFTVQRFEKLSITKALLVMPFLTHQKLLSYLSHGSVNVLGLDGLIIDRTACFSNFSKRFYDSLCLSINAIQFLNEIGLIEILGTEIKSISCIEYERSMGKRLEKIYKASGNLAIILNDTAEKLYLNLRVKL